VNVGTALDWLPALGWVDWTLLAVLAVSVLVGIVRGFVFECLSLAGWVVAWFAAQWGAPQLVPHLAGLVNLASAATPTLHAAALALCFVAALVVWGLLSRLVRMLVHATPLSLPDRLLGGGFGVLRGAVLLLAVASIVAFTPLAQSGPWRASQGARWLDNTLLALKPLLPPAAASLLSV
jgi:membrane protein required for colicin V production